MTAHVTVFTPGGLVVRPHLKVSHAYAVRMNDVQLGIAWPPVLDAMRAITEEVAAKHGLTLAALRGPSPRRDIAWPRQEAMWRMRQVKRTDGSHRYSLPQIGRFLGGRDHTTIIHGIRRHEARIDAGEAEAAGIAAE